MALNSVQKKREPGGPLFYIVVKPRAYAQHKLGVYGGYAHNNFLIAVAFCDRGSQKNRPGQAINYVQSAVVLLG